MEVLHTTVGEGPGGMPVIRGGVSVDLRCARGVSGDAPPSTWSPGGAWSLRDVRGGPTGSIEVELVSVEPPGNGAAEARCVVTLSPDALASELTVTNAASSSSPVALSGAVSNHLRVSTPDATYAVGLQGSDYRSREPIVSEFSILLPDSARLQQPHWAKRIDMFLSGEGAAAVAQEPDGEEDDDFKHLTAEMCRIYSHAPRDFTVIDRVRKTMILAKLQDSNTNCRQEFKLNSCGTFVLQGRRNSVCLSRRGFEELYVFSPGSKHEWYGKYAYVCIGPAMLKPVVLAPGATWQGAQCIRNPNL
jgi:hypothetical protein